MEAVRALHALGGDVNQADLDGQTPVFLAACTGCVAAVRALHELGASVTELAAGGAAEAMRCALGALGLSTEGDDAALEKQLLGGDAARDLGILMGQWALKFGPELLLEDVLRWCPSTCPPSRRDLKPRNSQANGGISLAT